MASIVCLVEECVYNHRSECQADNIEVRSSGCRRVEDADHTACSIFESAK